MVSKSMLKSLLERQLSFTPKIHPLYTFQKGAWQPTTPCTPSTESAETVRSLHLITWNIDFMASHPRARMESALRHLEGLVSRVPQSSAVVIFLQEMMETRDHGLLGTNDRGNEDARDISQIVNSGWVQAKFNVTDVDASRWDSPYAVATLIDRRLVVSSVSRLHFVSEYQRDALIVDICLASDRAALMRLCNVHLDSSYGSMRPIQWKAVARLLQDKDTGIEASILAGDCNANQPRDRTEPQDNGFKDAYLELGGVEDDESGATWGFQSIDWQRWGRQRLDKEVYWGQVEIKSLERIGIGVRVEDEAALNDLKNIGELPFVTDHYGLMGEFELAEPLSMVMRTE